MNDVDVARLRAELPPDPYRPAYHFFAPPAFTNDPHVVQWEGTYHLFYQYKPPGVGTWTGHWGHASSDDLLHWRDHPVAIAPTPGAGDEDSVMSGSVVDDDGTATAFYTGNRGVHERQFVATSDDEALETWETEPDDPVIDTPDPDATEHVFYRDPFVWRADGRWQMLLGTDSPDGATVVRHESENLRDWTDRGRFFVDRDTFPGALAEVPGIVPVDGRHLLYLGVTNPGAPFSDVDPRDVRYYVGDVDDGTFVAGNRGVVDYGDFYAPQAMVDDEGRTLMWGWLEEAAADGLSLDEVPWAGVVSLPRELDLGADGDLRMRPVAELRDLRERHAGHSGVEASDGTTLLDDAAAGDALEVEATIDPGTATEFGLVVRRSPEGDERTLLTFDRYADEFRLDRAESSASGDVETFPHRAPLPISGDPVEVRAFVDRSVVEVFVDESTCVTGRIYPTREDSTGVGVFARTGTCTAERLDVWQMENVWEGETDGDGSGGE